MYNWTSGLDYYRPSPRSKGKPNIPVSEFTPEELEKQYNFVTPFKTVVDHEYGESAKANQLLVTVCPSTKKINSIVSFDPNLPFIPIL